MKRHNKYLSKNKTEQKTPLVLKNEEIKYSGLFTAKELLERGDLKLDYIIDPLIPKSMIGAIAGMPGCGKSLLARQLCLQIVKGDETFLGFPLKTEYKRALYIATEDSAEAIKLWLDKQEFDNDSAKENLLLFVDDGLGSRKLIQEIETIIKRGPVDLIVIDAFGDIFEGSDNNNNMSMRNNLKPFTKLAAKHKIGLIFIHHTNKNAYTQAATQAHIQGGSGFAQKIRFALILEQNETNRQLSLVKHNYASSDLRKQSIVLSFNEINVSFTAIGKVARLLQPDVKKHVTTKDNKNTIFLLAKKLFNTAGEKLKHSELIRRICDIETVHKSTAKRRFAELLEHKQIIKVGNVYLRVTEKEMQEIVV